MHRRRDWGPRCVNLPMKYHHVSPLVMPAQSTLGECRLESKYVKGPNLAMVLTSAARPTVASLSMFICSPSHHVWPGLRILLSPSLSPPPVVAMLATLSACPPFSLNKARVWDRTHFFARLVVFACKVCMLFRTGFELPQVECMLEVILMQQWDNAFFLESHWSWDGYDDTLKKFFDLSCQEPPGQLNNWFTSLSLSLHHARR